ncbi:MAG: hypothetical protein ACMG6E_01060 [Candidatus Roizmanbacteria bacterium]
MSESFWRDEAYTYIMSRQSLLHILTSTAKDFNPPLYYIIIHFWMKIFGHGEVALRSFSLLCLVGTVLFSVLILEQFGKMKSKWIYIYAILMTFNPVVLYYSFEARMYALLALMTTVSWYFFLKKSHKWYIISSILALYTHYFFVLALISQYLVAFLWNKKETWRQHMVNAFAIGVAFLPWFIMSSQALLTKSTSFWIPYVTKSDVFNSFGLWFTGYEKVWEYYDPYLRTISGILLAIVLFLFISQRKFIKKNYLAKVLIMWAFIPFIFTFLVSFFKPLYVPRYIIFSNVGFMILIIYLIHNLPIVKRIIMILCLLLVIKHFTVYEVKYRVKGDIRKLISPVEKIIDKNHILVLTDPSMYFTIKYYYPEITPYIYREKKSTPLYFGLNLIPKSAFIMNLPIYPKKALLLDSSGEVNAISVY